MPPPTILARFRQVIGRAFRETGQAWDRVCLRGSTQAGSTKRLGDPAYIFNDHLSRHRNIMPLIRRGEPHIDPNVAYIAPCSSLIGTVHIGEGSSVFYGSVLRADNCNMGVGRSKGEFDKWRSLSIEQRQLQDSDEEDSPGGGGIFIGNGSNIQDGCIITSKNNHSVIGDNVTVGHCAQIHSAIVEDNCIIGMGAILNPGSKIESLSFIAAGAVIGKDEVVKSGELWVGNPARKIRDLRQEEKDRLLFQAEEYVKLASKQSGVMELGGNLADFRDEEVGHSSTDLDGEVQNDINRDSYEGSSINNEKNSDNGSGSDSVDSSDLDGERQNDSNRDIDEASSTNTSNENESDNASGSGSDDANVSGKIGSESDSDSVSDDNKDEKYPR